MPKGTLPVVAGCAAQLCGSFQLGLLSERQRNGREAWRILERECGEPTSALHINKKVLEWHGLTMAKDVGISASSIV